MRLRDYQNLLENSINSLKQLSNTLIHNTNVGRSQDVKVSGLIAFNDAISRLEQTGLFDKIIKNIRNLEYFNRAEDYTVVRQNEYDNLNKYREQLLTQVENLKKTIDNILPIEDKYSVSIKLPEYETFEEYNNLFKSLKIVFSTFDQLQYITELKTFETGSKWINIKFEKPNKEDIKSICIAILILFNMANSSLDLRNKYLEGQKSIAYLKQYETQVNDDKRKKILEAYEILQKEDNAKYEKYKEQIIEKILKESGIELDDIQKNDITPRVSTSLEKLGELIDEGMEIKPALNAPEEIKQISKQFNISLEEHRKILIGINPQKLIEQKEEQVTDKNEEIVDE